MKRFRLLTFVCAMLIGMSVISCIGTTDSNTVYLTYWAELRSNILGLHYFVTSDGVTITPTEASMNSAESQLGTGYFDDYEGKIAYVMFAYDKTVLEIAEDATDISGVTLLTFVAMDAPTGIVSESAVGTENDSVKMQAPIISLTHQYSNITFSPYFFNDDKYNVVLPINYYYNGTKTHYLSLIYYPDDEETITDKASGILRLYLRHNHNEDYGTDDDDLTSGGTTSFEYANSTGNIFLYYKTYDLRDIYTRYTMDGSSSPSRVRIVTMESSSSVVLSDAIENEDNFVGV